MRSAPVPNPLALKNLLSEVGACQLCAEHLPLGPRPVVRISATARLLIIGQAPGTRVHASGLPWDDASGNRLRQWLQLDKDTFYDTGTIAIMPMGFCYPGKGKGGDLPPRPECAPAWHQLLLASMPAVRLTLLIGAHAQKYYLQCTDPGVTQVGIIWEAAPAGLFPLVHPSPRNQRWLSRNPWFEADVVPVLQQKVRQLLSAP